MTDILEGLGPIAELGGQLAVVLGTLIVCWRLFNATWTTAATTLRQSADYAREEADELRQRIADLEAKTIEQAATISAFANERAGWIVERGRLEHRIEVLELKIARLSGEPDPPT